MHLAFIFYFAQNDSPERQEQINALRAAAPLVTQTVALVWAGVSVSALFILLPLLYPLPCSRFLAFMTVLISLGALVSRSICQNKKSLRAWGWFLVIAALMRVLLGAGIAWKEPWAESGLAAFVLAGFITLTPVLRQPEAELATMKEWRTL